ncbi:MAG: toll/interleukin-1 receptor domain-containing protein [Parvimonas sp.]|uniref:toll/interleukin-1 receptor domain-containing protein n=1 Tax=Parvimonas sp. TaxID=1944660 RepID=UPI001CB504C2|nr:toll/interleukin-1 receptor domain-containing protein [Parvimonas sp.]MBF1295540.1 toll/interleukin-1 receptor domain-containing protein [Parvimonas sp.]
MIFISHTTADKSIVEPIAMRLAKVFGKENVFYDSWSIQPGEGIIDRMNDGLEKCEFFFFFVSKNSLKSKMVSLEWENALFKKAKEDIKFIPVKLDECMMPKILLQTLYIDIFNNGLEVGLRQMIDVVNGQSTFHKESQVFNNITGSLKYNSESECIVEFKANYYLEPISNYAIILDNKIDDIQNECLTDGIRIIGNEENFKFPNGRIYNILFESVSRGTTPKFPYRVKLSTKSNAPLRIIGLMRATNEDHYTEVPYSYELE